LDCIAETSGILNDLKSSFGDESKQILSLAYFLVIEGESAMYRFPKFAKTHFHPYENIISSQRIRDIFTSISENSKMSFFKKRAEKCLENEYLAYDTTSISSYSEMMTQVKYGHNKDLDNLPQINLAMVFGETSMLPVYYRKLPGNINDVLTIKKLIKDLDFIDIKKAKLVLDRGFYSKDNINSLYRNEMKFIVSTRSTNKCSTDFIDEVHSTIQNFSNYNSDENIYNISKITKWKYEYQNKAHEKCSSNKMMYVHIYYNGEKAESEKTKFIVKLKQTELAYLSL